MNGILEFEGEYLDGIKHGKGKKYDDELIFEGEYIKGKPQIKFIIIWIIFKI